MSKRRLTLRRETLSELPQDDLSSVVGGVSAPNPLCTLLSINYSQCYSCGIGCTTQCPTRDC